MHAFTVRSMFRMAWREICLDLEECSNVPAETPQLYLSLDSCQDEEVEQAASMK